MSRNTNSADERISVSRLGEEVKFPNPFKREVTQQKVIDSRGNHYMISGQDPIDWDETDYECLAFPATSNWDQRNSEALVGGHTIDECIHYLEGWLNGSGDRGFAPTPMQKIQWMFEDEGDDVAFAWFSEEENGKAIIGQILQNVDAGRKYDRPDLAVGALLSLLGMLGEDFSDMPPDVREAIEHLGLDVPGD